MTTTDDHLGAFRDRAERLAAGLAGLGIASETRVTWQLPSRIDTVVASAALARLDAIQSPVLHLYAKELGFVLRPHGGRVLHHRR